MPNDDPKDKMPPAVPPPEVQIRPGAATHDPAAGLRDQVFQFLPSVAPRNTLSELLRPYSARATYGLGVRFGPSSDNEYHYEHNPFTGRISDVLGPAPNAQDVDEAGRLKPDSPSALREAGARLVAGLSDYVEQSAEGQYAAKFASSNSSGDGLFRPTTHEVTMVGIQAYFNGEEGNAVTSFLRKSLGENRADKPGGEQFQEELRGTLSRDADLRNPDSGINPERRVIDGFLSQNGYQPNSLTRAIAANPHLRALPPELQRQAFEGMAQFMQSAVQESEARAGHSLSEAEKADLFAEIGPHMNSRTIRELADGTRIGNSSVRGRPAPALADLGQGDVGANRSPDTHLTSEELRRVAEMRASLEQRGNLTAQEQEQLKALSLAEQILTSPNERNRGFVEQIRKGLRGSGTVAGVALLATLALKMVNDRAPFPIDAKRATFGQSQ